MNTVRRIGILLLAALSLACGGESYSEQLERERREGREAWIGPCRDESVLLATTAGSPSSFACPNRNHVMEVQVATAPSNEEAAALVFCKCRKAPTVDTKGE